VPPGSKPQVGVVDLQKAKQHIDEDYDREADRRVEPGGHLLNQAQHLIGAEIIRPYAGNLDAMSFQPGAHLTV